MARVKALARRDTPGLEITDVAAADYVAGQLGQWASPSLFQEPRLVIISGVDGAADALTEDLLEYVGNPTPEVSLLLLHAGGAGNRRVVDAIKRGGHPVWSAAAPKNRGDRVRVLRDQLRELNATASDLAVQQLLDGAGGDLHELFGIARQLVADHGGNIEPAHVEAYFRGRVETSGFTVADAMIEGDGPGSVVLARRAFASGVPPVMVVAALAKTWRDVAKVQAPELAPSDLGMAPWLARKARERARLWSGRQAGAAICLVARADEDVKGASRDARGAVEKCLIEISRLRSA